MAVTQRAKGIDVSHYKKNIDWRKGESKAGWSLRSSKPPKPNILSIRVLTTTGRVLAVKEIIRGAYHFFRPKVDPVAQANHFLRIAGQTLHQNDLPPVVDIEMYPDFMKHEWKSISREERFKRIQLWLQTVEAATGRVPVIYTEYYTWYELLDNTERFTRYPLWVANYKVEQPKVPANNWGGKGWWMWQTTDRGIVPGIREEAPCVDLNIFAGSSDDLSNWLGIESPRSIPPDDHQRRYDGRLDRYRRPTEDIRRHAGIQLRIQLPGGPDRQCHPAV